MSINRFLQSQLGARAMALFKHDGLQEQSKYESRRNAVFCPGFQKGRVPSEKGTFSVVNGPSKGHN